MTQPRTPAFRRTLSLVLGFILVGLSGPAWSLVKLEKAHLAVPGNGAKNAPGSTADVAALVSIDTGWHVNSHKPSFEYLIPTSLTLSSPTGWPAASVSYPADVKKKFTFAEQPLAVYEGDITITCAQAIPNDAAAGSYTLTATLTYQACNDQECLPPITTHGETTVLVGSGSGAAMIAPAPAHPGSTPTPPPAATAPAPSPTAAPLAAPGSESTSLALMLLLGLAGGLILNAMPCVLPVLSLKVFGLVRSAGEGASAVTKGAFTTALGILVSFWFLALAAIVAKAAGAAVGWGIQFQRPGFVAFLAIVTVLFSLNLWGLFEVELPVGLAQLGGKAAREGMAGHFASGLFATLMATPCSAPMLGTALGFALSQRWPTILAIFTAVGVGMALPYIVLGLFPTAARFLPKPGTWMETMRGILGFLLAGAAVWLLYVMAAQVSPERLATFEGTILVAMGLLTWFGSRREGRAAVAVTLVALFAIGGIATASGGPRASGNARLTGPAAGLIPWVAFDRTQADTLAAKGQLVFVDVTADWCFTCKVNERLILDTPEVAKAFATHHVLPMRADWTNRDDIIGSFLAAHGRYGIPFYMLYRPGQTPVVFSELPSKSGLVEAVRLADAALKPEARS